QAEDGIRDYKVTGVQTCALPISPGHPVAEGLTDGFAIPRQEMYGEHFDVPPPEELVFISWFEGGEVFRSGCCFTRGRGRIFYFRSEERRVGKEWEYRAGR